MTQEEDENGVASEAPVAVSLLNEIKDQLSSVNQLVRNIITRLHEPEVDFDKGLSFLDVKNHSVLDYLLNLVSVIGHKCSGQSIDGLASIDRLVELRTVLERMRPMEHKLKYQIDKLVRLATTGTLPENDPLRLKANPENLMSKIEGSDESDEDESDDGEAKSTGKKAGGVYVPPKLSAMHYDGDETAEQRATKTAEKRRKQALSYNVLQDLREEFMDTPVEVVETSSTGRHSKRSRDNKEKQEFEETYFTRLQVTRQERHKNRQQNFVSAESELFDLDGFKGPVGAKKSKLSKTKGKGKAKGGFKKKRKH